VVVLKMLSRGKYMQWGRVDGAVF